jgi:hypothetical protein
MPTLVEIIQEDARYVERSRVTITANTVRSWVCIADEDGNEVFMQGQEADEFNDRATQLYNDAQLVTLEECRAHLARPYVDSMI